VSSITDLVTKARFLRNASPRAYDEFCVAFANYSVNALDALVMATDDLQLQQGYVRQCRTIMKALEEAKNG
jgi:hypothetical protein